MVEAARSAEEGGMRIGELARQAGLNPATVRYYERRGLLSRPARTAAGYRSYAAETVVQLRLIRWAKDVGFTLREVRELLQIVGEHAQRPGGQVRRRFQAKLEAVEARLRQLTAIRDQLQALARCDCRGNCPIIARALAAAVSTPAAAPEAPIACRPRALDKAQRRRQQELLRLVRSRVQAIQDLPDGYTFRLEGDPILFRQAAEWVALERRCCPFVAFGLEWRTDETVWVRLTGGPGVKEALEAEFLGERASRPGTAAMMGVRSRP
jgi:MerR family transcriptional regulator, copper efflux regulator